MHCLRERALPHMREQMAAIKNEKLITGACSSKPTERISKATAIPTQALTQVMMAERSDEVTWQVLSSLAKGATTLCHSTMCSLAFFAASSSSSLFTGLCGDGRRM